MVDLKDFIIKEVPRKTPRFKGEMTRHKYYATYCDKCKNLRGYLSKTIKETTCRKCSDKVKENLTKNHWTKKGLIPHNKGAFSEETALRVKIGTNLRCRLNKAIKGNFKSGSAVSDLGCSIEDFKKYIESLWQPGMNWENWTRKGWHMDHIVPLASFELSDPEQLKKACHYTNIQPMWAKENLSKGNKLQTDIINSNNLES